ncbi:hypothetical protein SAMN05216266_12840 [Amycolatopsis marina]|uniref:Uncharacterized protein n=1 Tax=Amycolatopsis marina TaxID=490629 RepID=A0A1I1CHN9_9PSEU|nr:hypothetical protein [Amycolatopsis marina]SFB61572.1 hypothetical protein SAMN05216266_12840 [Amycolatopsis marina]
MAWSRHIGRPDPAEDKGWLAGVKAEEKVRLGVQAGQAARTVASHCEDAEECAEMLAMLGLLPGQGISATDQAVGRL